MTNIGRIVLFIGICSAVAGAVIGFRPLTADTDSFALPCGSALGGGVASPPPICSEPLSDAGTWGVSLLGLGVAAGSAALIFGRE